MGMDCGPRIDAAGVLEARAMMRASTGHRKSPPPAAPPQAFAGAIADPSHAPLVALVERMVSADQSALAEFYDATLGKAYGITLRIVRNAALAEEVVGDAYHQAWREAAHYDRSRGGPLTWLLMICRSRALDALRARSATVSHEAPETLASEEDQGRDVDPFDLLAAVESRHRLQAALAALTPAQRQMIGLAFFRGLTHHEIAEQTQLPLGTVKSQIRRALSALRCALTADTV